MDPDGMHLGNPKTAKIFIKNFFTDFKATLGRGHVIKDFKKCDFEPIRKHLEEQKIWELGEHKGNPLKPTPESPVKRAVLCHSQAVTVREQDTF